MGNQLPFPQRGTPQFSTHICCGQMAAWIKMPLNWYHGYKIKITMIGMTVGLGLGNCVRWGRRTPPHKEGGAPKFSANVVYCNQTAGWIKMVLDMEVGLSQATFISERELTFTFAICYRPSVCLSSVCLSSVCLSSVCLSSVCL